MATLPEDELILFYYGEHPAPAVVGAQLARDPALAARYAGLCRELDSWNVLHPAEPRPGLEARLWARLAPELARTSPSARPASPQRLRWLVFGLAGAAALAACVLALRFARVEPGNTEAQVATTLKALPPAARERVLAAALADHLASSERLLVEVSNADSSATDEHRWAASLLEANRLYRRAAERAGQRRIALVLSEMEPVLLQLANTPATAGIRDVRLAREQIESRDLLFKVRVTRSNL